MADVLIATGEAIAAGVTTDDGTTHLRAEGDIKVEDNDNDSDSGSDSGIRNQVRKVHIVENEHAKDESVESSSSEDDELFLMQKLPSDKWPFRYLVFE